MKKLVLLLAVVASATLFSCSGNKAANDSTAADTTVQTEDTAAPLTLQLLLTLLQLRLNSKHRTVNKIRTTSIEVVLFSSPPQKPTAASHTSEHAKIKQAEACQSATHLRFAYRCCDKDYSSSPSVSSSFMLWNTFCTSSSSSNFSRSFSICSRCSGVTSL